MPGRALVEGPVAGGLQALGQAAGGMEGGGRGLEEVDQALVQFFAHTQLRTAMPRVYRIPWRVWQACGALRPV
ncbi:hypothetical protein D3C80_1888180 [compost metagenome]